MKTKLAMGRCVAARSFWLAFVVVVTVCQVNSAKGAETQDRSGSAKPSLAVTELPSFEAMLSMAMQNNPDMRVAESAMRSAQVNLDRVRLQVAKEIKTFREQWQVESAAWRNAEATEKNAERVLAIPDGAVSGSKVIEAKSIIQASRIQMELSQAHLREMKLMLPLLLGAALSDERGETQQQKATSTIDTKSDDVEKLLRERLQTLVEVARLQEQAYKQGESSFDSVLSAQTEVLTARLELAKTPPERISIREELVAAARQLQDVTERKYQAQQATQTDVLRAKALRLRADADLLQERGKQP